jgi:hypothetical protein
MVTQVYAVLACISLGQGGLWLLQARDGMDGSQLCCAYLSLLTLALAAGISWAHIVLLKNV